MNHRTRRALMLLMAILLLGDHSSASADETVAIREVAFWSDVGLSDAGIRAKLARISPPPRFSDADVAWLNQTGASPGLIEAVRAYTPNSPTASSARPGGSGTVSAASRSPQPGGTVRPLPGRPQDGMKVVSKAEEEQAKRHFEKGMAFAEAEKWPQAEAEYRAAVRLDPRFDECWDALGDVCFEQKKWSEAEQAHREAVRLKPEESYYRAQRARDLLQQGRRNDALKEAQESLRLGLDDHRVFDELGMTVTSGTRGR